MRRSTALAGSLKLPYGAAQGFDFPFIGGLFPFGHLERFEHFFHVLERVPEDVNDMVHLLEGLLNVCGCGWLKILPGGWGSNFALNWTRGGFRIRGDWGCVFIHRANGFRRFCFQRQRRLGCARRWPTAMATTTATAPVTTARWLGWPGRLRLLRHRPGFRFFVGSHFLLKLP